MSSPRHIRAHDNPLLARVRRLLQGGSRYRRAGQIWLEGDHLCAALRARGGSATQALLTEEAWADPTLRDLACWAAQVAVVPSALFARLTTLESPSCIGFLIDVPAAVPSLPAVPSVVLDRVQDAGNVGSILRSAAAFGVQQVLALKGSAALWSPKVLRAGMGAHFALRLVEGLEAAAVDTADGLDGLALPWVAADVHGGVPLPEAELPWPCAWVFGNEGQGVAAALLGRCALRVRIPQPGGEESLNVAAAAAVCLYESARRAGDAHGARRSRTQAAPSSR